MSDWDCTDVSICMAIGQHLREAVSFGSNQSETECLSDAMGKEKVKTVLDTTHLVPLATLPQVKTK
jgi:hypothetical protein